MNLPTNFLRHLQFWSLHVTLGASLSFLAALSVKFNRAQSVIGMVLGVLVFILIYATIWSSAWFRRRVPEGSRWDQALTCGARTRSVISLLGMAAVALHLAINSPQQQKAALTGVPVLVVFMPEAMSGLGVGLLTEWCVKSPLVRTVRVAIGGPNAHDRYESLGVGDVNSLVPTFCITLMQGVIMSLYLLVLSAIALGAMRCKRWRKAGLAHPPSPAAALT